MTGSETTGLSVLIDREARRVSHRIADSLEEQAKALIASGYAVSDLQTVYRQGGEYPPVVVPKWVMERVNELPDIWSDPAGMRATAAIDEDALAVARVRPKYWF